MIWECNEGHSNGTPMEKDEWKNKRAELGTLENMF